MPGTSEDGAPPEDAAPEREEDVRPDGANAVPDGANAVPDGANAVPDDEDALRRRYREALERKLGKRGGGGRGGAHGPGSESMSATANAKTQRTFRRKSGG